MPRIFILTFALLMFATGLACDGGSSDEIENSKDGNDVLLVMYEQGDPISVSFDPDASARSGRLRRIARALVEGLGSGPGPVLPEGSRLSRVVLAETTAEYYIVLPDSIALGDLEPETLDRLTSQFINTLLPLGETGAAFFFANSGSDFSPAAKWLPSMEPVGEKPFEKRASVKSGPAHPGLPQYTGGLSGKTVFISAGHGWYWTGSDWLTQRGNTNGIVEDFSNVEPVNQYLLHYLYNAGASVWPCRERSMNTNEVIVDNADAGFSSTGGFSTSTATSGYWGANYAAAQVSTTESALATWTPDIPEDGYYDVYLWYTGGTNRATDAKFTVYFPGGENTVLVNQSLDAFTFKHLGRYYFHEGEDAGSGSVILSNEASDPSTFVVADAVRFGGGMGGIDPGGGVSGRPRYEESGRYFSEFMGCSTCNTSTVTAMPRYAKWESEYWEDSVYLSWHSNAPNPGTGTSSFAYSSAGWGGAFTGIDGSLELRDFIHDEVVADIRAGYDSNWTDRGKTTADFGEINPNYNDEMPSALIEIAFHDTPSDAAYLKDPGFKRLVSRAVYQGIVKYFAGRDGLQYTLLPEPPTHVQAINTGSGVEVSWVAPEYDTGDGLLGDAATGYRVYAGPDGRSFALAADVPGKVSSVRLSLTAQYYRVSAYNDGGESFPSEAVASTDARRPSRVLVVNGFDRLGPYQLIEQHESPVLGDVKRMFLDRMNSFDYVRSVADLLVDKGIAFDTAGNEAALDLNWADYECVVWIAGEESATDETLSDEEQAAMAAYLDQGGALLISGSEIGWDLDILGSASDLAFYNSYLKAELEHDDADTYDFHGSAGGLFAGLFGAFDDSTHGIYDTEWADALIPLSGAACVMEYDTGHCAALQYDAGYRMLYFGFGIEGIYDDALRWTILDRAFDFLLNEQSGDDLVFFRGREHDGCFALEWGVPQSLDAAFFMPLRSADASGAGVVELSVEAMPADNLHGDYRYGFVTCEPPYDGYYFLEVETGSGDIFYYGPVQWPEAD